MPTRIKICGLTRASDALAAVAAGADTLGVVLAPSPRQITLDQAEAVLAAVPAGATRVGVFVDPDLAFVAEAVARLGLGAVQLSGSESVEFCADLARTVAPATLVKAFSVAPGFNASTVGRYLPFVSAILLDTYVAGSHGGTGRTFDWQAARALPPDVPLIVAGGLTPENVGDAVRALRPCAVDVSSGVESAPGIKDHRKIQSFVAAVRAADEEEPPR